MTTNNGRGTFRAVRGAFAIVFPASSGWLAGQVRSNARPQKLCCLPHFMCPPHLNCNYVLLQASLTDEPILSHIFRLNHMQPATSMADRRSMHATCKTYHMHSLVYDWPSTSPTR